MARFSLRSVRLAGALPLPGFCGPASEAEPGEYEEDVPCDLENLSGCPNFSTPGECGAVTCEGGTSGFCTDVEISIVWPSDDCPGDEPSEDCPSDDCGGDKPGCYFFSITTIGGGGTGGGTTEGGTTEGCGGDPTSCRHSDTNCYEINENSCEERPGSTAPSQPECQDQPIAAVGGVQPSAEGTVEPGNLMAAQGGALMMRLLRAELVRRRRMAGDL